MIPGGRHLRGQQLWKAAAALERTADLKTFELQRKRRTRLQNMPREARATGVRRTYGWMRRGPRHARTRSWIFRLGRQIATGRRK